MTPTRHRRRREDSRRGCRHQDRRGHRRWPARPRAASAMWSSAASPPAPGILVTVVIALIAAFLVITAAPSLIDNEANFTLLRRLGRRWRGPEVRYPQARLRNAAGVAHRVVDRHADSPGDRGLPHRVRVQAGRRAGDLPRRPARRRAVDRLRPVGILVLGPAMVPVNNWLVANAGFLPFFAEPADNVTNMSTGGTLLTAGSCWR